MARSFPLYLLLMGKRCLKLTKKKLTRLFLPFPTPAEVGAATDCWGAFPNHAFGTSCDAAVTGRLFERAFGSSRSRRLVPALAEIVALQTQ